jgi:acyl carrier protein
MNSDELRATVLRVLGTIAPEADLAAIESAKNLRDQLDLDSMDFLNFLIGLEKEIHVDIPERDYRQLTTLDACVAYLFARQSSEPTS